MRIGILTLPLHTNYGGILQAYALQTVLERMGHEVVIFDCPLRKFKLPIWKKPLCYSKRIIKKLGCQVCAHNSIQFFGQDLSSPELDFSINSSKPIRFNLYT